MYIQNRKKKHKTKIKKDLKIVTQTLATIPTITSHHFEEMFHFIYLVEQYIQTHLYSYEHNMMGSLIMEKHMQFIRNLKFGTVFVEAM